MHHSTAIIDPSAKIDDSVEIGPYSVIGPDVTIGRDSKIESHVILKGPTQIGQRNHVFQFSTIGDGSPDKKYKDEPTLLIIGDDNIIREGVTIHRGTVQDKGETRIGNSNLIMAYAHIAHDCILGNDIVLTNQAALAGSVKVGDGAIFGGYAIVHQYCSIGSYSFCAMGSSVNKDVPAYVKVRGNPAKPFGINVTGIKRLGYTSEVVESLRSAYRSVYRKKMTVEEAISDLTDLRKKNEEVNIFLKSIEESTRGISR
ncbi:MAG TPA: acyl-ACP--UDP-N-acetylglucosamine O-acyltransferase [SAR86 cluster bacterium]|nr:acyl-ACP--UDP-N-acetylglucosamine O-acyltransferase [SAR86 cluster bacterium]|tara:strand:- start:21 stop:791 length:771 start_codon:yes stop_codon:yes gene_type:complete